jgi:hypothetical protein
LQFNACGEEDFMGMLWKEEMMRLREEYREEPQAWELLHEEEGFEDTGWMYDHELSDLDGQETHMHFHAEAPGKAMKH